MKKTNKQPILFMIAMVAYIAIMLFGIIFGSEYPMVFFWAMMALTLFVFIVLIRPKVKDALILCGGVLILAVVYEFATTLADYWAPINWVWNFLIKVLLNAPVYFLVWNHFLKTIRNSKLGAEVEEARKVGKK